MTTTPAATPDAAGRDESAYQQLRAAIAAGDIEPGSWLRETALAERLGVSRTPVREAIRRLASDGMVEISRHKGAQVVSFTPEDLAGLYDIRAQFEPHATLLAVPLLSDGDVETLASLSSTMEQRVRDGRLEDLGTLNNAFHEVFVARCGNRYFTSALNSLMRPAVVAQTFRQYDSAALERSMRHHAELVVAARARDGEWAESVMRTHILAARNAVSPSLPR